MPLLCIVKLPDHVNSKNEKLFHTSAHNIYHALSVTESSFEKIVAVGYEEVRSLWPGENWAEIPSAADSFLSNHESEIIFLIGLDAPFFSKNTIDKFLSLFSKIQHKTAFNAPLCTFRKTPFQKNPASLMHGGYGIASVRGTGEMLTASIRKLTGEAHSQDSGFSIAISEDSVLVQSNRELQFMLDDKIQNKQYYWNGKHPNENGQNGPIHYSEKNGAYRLKFSNDCMLHVLNCINTPGLYNKIQYIYTPVTIDGVIGTDHTQNRINLQTGESISGRQGFPEIYEPFLGMTVADTTFIREILMEGDAGFGTREILSAFIVGDDESKLISDDPLMIQAELNQRGRSGPINQNLTEPVK